MALQSLRVTKKEIIDYYNPKVSDYQRMVNSINANGYGQIIQRYLNTEILETYYNEYSYSLGQMVVYNPTTGQVYIESEAGPAFWNVSSLEGLAFLSGTYDISGLRKLKYCNNCSDGNGLPYDTVNNFQQRFTQLSSLVSNFGLYEGFLFYDLDQPAYTNVYPSVKYDDGVNITYYFKTIDGEDRTLAKMSEDTGQSVIAIEASITTAPVVKPQVGSNTVITSCCDESISYVISGQYTIGNILYTQNGLSILSYCWFVESLTNNAPTLGGEFIFTSGGRSCAECVKLNPCPVVCDTINLTYSTNPATACMGDPSPYQTDGEILYEDGACGTVTAPIGYYGESRSGRVYYWDGVTLEVYGPCPSQDNYLIEWCCDRSQEVISSSGKPLTSGQYIYFDTYGARPVNCWYVKGNTTDPTTIEGTLNGATYMDCNDCQNQLGQFCKRRA